MKRRFILFICSIAGGLLMTACYPERGSKPQVQPLQGLVEDKLIQFMVYGELPPSDYLDENDKLLTRSLGFELIRVADCEVSDSLVKFVDHHNATMREQMSKKYGTYWIDSIEMKTSKRFHLP